MCWKITGLSHADSLDLFRYFEYTAVQDFDAAGRFRSDTKIVLRRKGQLFEAINGRDRVTLVVGDEQYVLPVPRSPPAPELYRRAEPDP